MNDHQVALNMRPCANADESPMKRMKTEERNESMCKSTCWIQSLPKLKEEERQAIRRLYDEKKFPFVIRELRNNEIVETDWLQLPLELRCIHVYNLVNSLGKVTFAMKMSDSDKHSVVNFYNVTCERSQTSLLDKFNLMLEQEQTELNRIYVAELRGRVESYRIQIEQDRMVTAHRYGESTKLSWPDVVKEAHSYVCKLADEFCTDAADWRRKQQALAAVRFDDDDGSKPQSFMKIRLDFLRERSLEITKLLLCLLRLHVPEVKNSLRLCLQTLTRASFVIVVQPNQVLCKKKRFGVNAELLNFKELQPSLHNLTDHKVTVRVLSENGLSQMLAGNSAKSVAVLSRADAARPLDKPEFDRLQWLSVDREEGGEVAEQKYFLLLEASLHFVDNSSWNISIHSLPIVFTTHSTIQGKRAAATIFWHNSFADPLDRNQRVAHESQPCAAVFKALRRWIGYATGRLPLESDMQFVRKWLTQVTKSPLDRINFPQLVTTVVFNNKVASFTMWEWLYAIKHLIQSDEFLKVLWQNNYIYGFITRDDGSKLLMTKANVGTILVRFSCSKLGAVTLLGYLKEGQAPESVVGWNADELAELSLDTRMSCLAPDYICTHADPRRQWRHLLRNECSSYSAGSSDYKPCVISGIRIIGSDAWLKESLREESCESRNSNRHCSGDSSNSLNDRSPQEQTTNLYQDSLHATPVHDEHSQNSQYSVSQFPRTTSTLVDQMNFLINQQQPNVYPNFNPLVFPECATAENYLGQVSALAQNVMIAQPASVQPLMVTPKTEMQVNYWASPRNHGSPSMPGCSSNVPNWHACNYAAAQYASASPQQSSALYSNAQTVISPATNLDNNYSEVNVMQTDVLNDFAFETAPPYSYLNSLC